VEKMDIMPTDSPIQSILGCLLDWTLVTCLRTMVLQRAIYTNTFKKQESINIL
jgi:hypothetical protein